MTISFDKVSVREEDAIRLIIEFLSRRELCISQLSLERESGIYNVNVGDDLIFLRQLILDGQWEDALQFVQPLESLENFSSQQFHFIIYKHKYVELLCIRSEASAPSQSVAVEVAVQDIIDCLNELERYCPSRDDYNRLSSLLTLPNLTDDEELRNWNPNSWRLKCFHDVMPLVEKFMQTDTSSNTDTTTGKKRSNCIAKNDRLMNLIFKGLMYEVCLDAVAHKLGRSGVEKLSFDPDVMNGVESTFNLHSFLQSVPNALLEAYSTDSRRNTEEPLQYLDIEVHDKPQLIASWSEMILSRPLKPNVFPHMQVPYTRIKAADLMSKSLSTSLMKSPHAKDMMAMSVCDIAQFSRSTLASTGFHLNSKDTEENEHEEGEKNKENTKSIDNSVEQTANICDTSINVMNTSIDRLFKSQNVFTSKGLSSALDDRMPTIKELATPTTPISTTEAFDPFTSTTCPSVKGGHQGNDEMNESFLDIWMKSQHQYKREKRNKLNRTMSNRLSTAQRRPLSLASSSSTSTWGSSAQKRTAAFACAPVTRKHSTASWSSSKATSSITPATMPSASGSYSSINTATTSTSGQVLAGRLAGEQHFTSAHSTHNSSRFVGGTPANTKIVTSTPMQPKQGGKYAAANSIKHQLFDERSLAQYSPIFESQSSNKPFAHSTVPPSKGNASPGEDGNYYINGSNKHGLRSSLSSPSPHPNHNHPLSHQHSNPDQSTGNNDNLKSGDEAIRFVSVAKFEDQQAIRTAEFHPSGHYFAVGSNSRLLRVFHYSSQDKNNNTTDSLYDFSPPELIFERPRYHKGSIYCLAWNKIGNLLATGSNDKTIKLLTFDQESQSFHPNEVELPVHDGTVRDVCFMDDLTNGSSLLLSGGAGDCKVNITDCETATTFLSLSGHSGPVLSLYTWGGAMFVSGSQDRTIRFWDLRSNSCINFVTCPTISRTKPGGAVAAVSVDPTGKLLVSGHEDSTCMLYDVRGGRVIQTFHPHSADIRTLRFSNKAYYLLSGGYDNKIVLTDLQGDLTQPLKSVVVAEHEDKVIQCRWHPTEFVFASTSADKTAQLWALPD